MKAAVVLPSDESEQINVDDVERRFKTRASAFQPKVRARIVAPNARDNRAPAPAAIRGTEAVT